METNTTLHTDHMFPRAMMIALLFACTVIAIFLAINIFT